MDDSHDPFRWADDLGPEKIVHVTEPSIGLRAVLAVDNTASGPAIGGVRMALDASAEEAFRLARAMTLKNAAAGLAHGGGKSVILANPHGPIDDRERLVRAFACAIRNLVDYIPGPDMGTDERAMAWIHDEIGRACGLPAELGGIPLDELGATGFGLASCAEEAQAFCDVRLDGARVVIQGFGNVGRPAARFLAEKGAVLVAASDSKGSIAHAEGLDVEALIAATTSGGSVLDVEEGSHGKPEAVIDVACDVWIPCARPDVVHERNVERLDTKLILQGANIPISPGAEASLHARGVLSVPDFVANAGGVICAATEVHGGSREQAFEAIDSKIRDNTRTVLRAACTEACLPRAAAATLAIERVRRAAATRRFHASSSRQGASGNSPLDL
ncbi:MAG: Glu/Leu/Phe/Val dehydrogenase [bacterium]|nr:Glu/Leu/Phe/Val dehydrogenase [bacterium]